MKELYSQGVPVAKIAEMTGVTRRTIYNRLKKIGLKG
ncbi:helix-turn-helix domain-containing protein [Enterococcus termitis]